jgi:hypothetical protein
MSLLVTGLLIRAVTGRAGALGRRVKRRGFAVQAAFRTAWRLSWIAGAVPIYTEYGVCSAIPECRCSWL